MIIGLFAHRRRWLSNFYNTKVHYMGRFTEAQVPYASVEHAYQAQKATNRHDHHYIASASGAGEARRRGREITPRGDFDEFKEFLMLRLLYAKFIANPTIRKQLIATFPHELIHGNMHSDEFWGINRRTGAGENKLGKLLMLLRDMFRAGTQDQILAVEARKKAKILRYMKWKRARSQRLKDANRGLKSPPSMAMSWDEKKTMLPSVAARHKGKADIDKGIQGMRSKIKQEEIKQETREWLKKQERRRQRNSTKKS